MQDPEVLDASPRAPFPEPQAERQLMHVLYGMHTLAWLTLGTLALIALVMNYVRRADTRNLLYAAHHRYMIATFWWTVLWLLVTSPLYFLFILPGMVAHGLVGLWYLYRCLRGWMRLAEGRLPQDLS